MSDEKYDQGAQGDQDDQAVINFIRGLLSRSKLTMVRDAALTQDLALLQQLERADVFSVKSHNEFSDDPYDGLCMFNTHEFPAIAALACVVHGVTSAKIKGLTLDPPLYKLPSAGSGLKAVAGFIQLQVEGLLVEKRQRATRYVDLETPYEASRECRVFNDRYQGTLSALLGAAAAMNDPELTECICTALSDGRTSPPFGRDLSLSVSEHIYQPDNNMATNMVSPAVVAIHFDAYSALDVMRAHGWSALESPARKVAPFNAERALKFCFDSGAAVKTLYLCDEFLLGSGTLISAGMTEKLLPLLQVCGLFPTPEGKDIQRWAENLLDHNELPLGLISAALKGGAYGIDAPESYRLAAGRGMVEIIDALGPDLDWSVFTPNQRPIDNVLKSSQWDDYPDEMAEVALQVMRHALDHGRGDLLAEPGLEMSHTHMICTLPILNCTKLGFSRGVRLCLEQGADPYYKGDDDMDTLALAESLGMPEISAIVRSFMASKAAKSAIDDLGLSAKLSLFNRTTP